MKFLPGHLDEIFPTRLYKKHSPIDTSRLCNCPNVECFSKTNQSIGNLGVRLKVGVAMLVSQGEVQHLSSYSVVIYPWRGGTLKSFYKGGREYIVVVFWGDI